MKGITRAINARAPRAYVILRRDYPTGYRIPYAVCLSRERATLLACQLACEFGESNPEMSFDATANRFRYTDSEGRQVVFCVETLPFLADEK